jgi:hypothetical protein
MNKRDIEKHLLSMIIETIPLLAKNNDLKNLNSAFYYKKFGNNQIVAMSHDEKEKLEAPARFLLSLREISEKYSEKHVDSELDHCYDLILSDQAGLCKYVRDFIEGLVNKTAAEFCVISEIENIEIIDDQPYEFIDSVIKILRQEDISISFREVEPHISKILNQPAIITKVKAAEVGKAQEIALHRFLVSLNLIRLFVPSYRPALKGSLHTNIQRLMAYNQAEISFSNRRIGDLLLRRAKMSADLYNEMLRSGISELKKENSISTVIKECLYWYGLGLDEDYPSARLLNYVTVLESALKKKDEKTELRRTVAERGAMLLNDRFEYRKPILRDLGKIYDLRSKVVHTGALINDRRSVSKAGSYARLVLLMLMEESASFHGDFNEFISHIDDLKLGKT